MISGEQALTPLSIVVDSVAQVRLRFDGYDICCRWRFQKDVLHTTRWRLFGKCR